MMITRVSGKLWKGMRERWMEILFFVIVIGVVYWFFHRRITESYSGKNVYSKDEIKSMKNKYLDAKSVYEAANRTYNNPNNEIDYPIKDVDYTVGDPRILSLPLPTKTSTYQNRDGNDPYKICGSKFLNYEPGICLDTEPQKYLRVTTVDACKTNTRNQFGVFDKDDNLLFNATYTCTTSSPTIHNDKCPGTGNNATYTCLTESTLPTSLPGSTNSYKLMDDTTTLASNDSTKKIVANIDCGPLKAYRFYSIGVINKTDGNRSDITTNTLTAYKSTDKVDPVNIPGCYTYRQAKKTEMDNAWNIYSPFAPRKKKHNRRKSRFF